LEAAQGQLSLKALHSLVMPQIVFLSLFLGLISGMQPVEMQVDPAIKSVRITIGGNAVASLDHPPWRATIDFGPELEPRELAAIGYDERGNEIARATQILNLPRPVAELEIVLRNENERPAAAELRWRHRVHAHAKRARIEVDGKKLRVDRTFRALLPSLNWSVPHVVSAELRFDDGVVARREIVISGNLGYSDTVGSQLTPIVVTHNPPHEPGSLENCFAANGFPVRTAATEKTNALVVVVKDPEATEAIRAYVPQRGTNPSWTDRQSLRGEIRLGPDTTERILWPLAARFTETGQPASDLFEPSADYSAANDGMLWLLTRSYSLGLITQPRRFADAVATAGLRATAQGRRRAVVLVLSEKPDTSFYSPQMVRRYLQAVGVPLVVWSLTGLRPDLEPQWGEIEDISTTARLRAAVERLKYTLAIQRVAWVATDPLTALHVAVKEGCEVETLARPH
jgi:hypothetical protein